MFAHLLLAGAAVPLGEAWVALPPDVGPDALTAAGALVTEDRRPDGRIRVLLDAWTARLLLQRGYALSDQRSDHRLGAPPAGYHTPESGDALLDDLAATSPRAGRVRMGTSVEGRAIEGLWLGQTPESGAAVERVLGTHHGDEASSYEVTLAFAERLASTDGSDPAVTELLDRTTVWIVPLVNPDGFVEGSRTNSGGVDLNRNYDWEWSPLEPFSGPMAFSEPETRAVRSFGTWTRPHTALTLHSGATNLGWPWNHTLDPTPDADTLERLARVYADLCTVPGFWVTQGSQWYISRGDTNDWAYGRHGTLDLTLEVSVARAPASSQLPEVAAGHIDAMIALLGTAPTLEGRVTDAVSGEPVEATMTIGGGAFLGDPVTGRFHHHAAPDPSAELVVEAPGYRTVSVPVSVTEGSVASVEVALEPDALDVGWLEPSVLRTARPVALPSEQEGAVTLRHPASEPLLVDAVGGEMSLDPNVMAPGAWSVELPDGTVLLRALWVDDPVSAHVDSWSEVDDGGEVRVTGAGFGIGARAVAFVGPSRTVVPLQVRWDSEERLWLDVDALPPPPERVDVAVWTNGSLLGLDDLWSARALVDDIDDDVLDEVRDCGCTTGTKPAAAAGWLLLAFAARRRPTRSVRAAS